MLSLGMLWVLPKGYDPPERRLVDYQRPVGNFTLSILSHQSQAEKAKSSPEKRRNNTPEASLNRLKTPALAALELP
jgi:hypothetical protein